MATKDSLLHYSVGNWSQYGLAVPNWGKSPHTVNADVWDLVQTMGRGVASFAWSEDAVQRKVPNNPWLWEVHKACLRVRGLLASRVRAEADFKRLQAQHVTPAPEVHMVFPVPCFYLPNAWAKRWTMLALRGISEAMQHTDNGASAHYSPSFAASVGQYYEEIYRSLAVELLMVSGETATTQGFTLTEADFKKYDPYAVLPRSERIDNVPNFAAWPTENDIEVLTNGIPASQLPQLQPWRSLTTTAEGDSQEARPAGTTSFISQPGQPQ
jgi:hypothetical protein